MTLAPLVLASAVRKHFSYSSWVARIMMPFGSRAETVRNFIFRGIHRMSRLGCTLLAAPLFAYGVDIAFSGYKIIVALAPGADAQVFMVYFSAWLGR